MSRQVRRVPPGWNHPTYFHVVYRGRKELRYVPLHTHATMCTYFDDDSQEFVEGIRPAHMCMPVWTAEEATYYMMYETCSEGTPISPSFETPEKLAQWLVDNEIGIFGCMQASYEEWLKIAAEGKESHGLFVNCFSGEVTVPVFPK